MVVGALGGPKNRINSWKSLSKGLHF